MAGFRDKDSQLVPEADPPMGQGSSSREQSVHGREVPDENRNVKSKGTAATNAKNNMIIMDNKCANCSYDFTINSSPSRAKVSDVVVPSEVSSGLSVGASAPQTVKVKYAFEYVFNIKTQDSQVDVAACSDCAQYLAGVYGLVSKLSQLRTVDSYFEKRIKHQQDLINKSESGKKGAPAKKAKGPSVPVVKGAQYKTKKEKASKPTTAARASATPPATPKTTPKSKKKGRGIGSELPSNIRDFIDPRPSRASKLTAMVLMNNTFEAPIPKSTPKASPPTPPPEPKGAKKAVAAKKPQKKKADEPPAAVTPPAKKLKLSSEKPAAKARGKKAPAAAQAPPSVPVTPTGTKTPKAKATPRASLKKSAKKDQLAGSSETSSSTPSAVVAAEPKKGKGKGKKSSTSLEEAIAASKLSSELKIPSVPLSSPAETKGKKPKKEKAPKKPKIMLSKATSTTTKRNEDSSAAKEDTPVPPPAAEDKKKATKKKPKKSSETGATTEGGSALDLSLKIPQVPIPTAGSTPKPKKSKGKKDATDIPAQAGAPVPVADLKPKAPKKGKAAKAATSLTTKEEDTSAQAAPKKNKKGKKDEVSSILMSSVSPPAEVGNKATAAAPKFTCKSCGKDFTARWNLRRHDLLVHELPLSPPFNCNVCSQEFQARKALLEHKMSGPCASAPSSSASPEVSKASSSPSMKKSKGDDKKEPKIKVPKGPGKDSEGKKPTKSPQPKGSAIKDTKEQGGDKPAKKEKQDRKRKSLGDDKSTTKTAKKSKKSENAAVGTGSNIPKGSSDSKTGAAAHLNGPIESAATPQEIGSSAQDPKMTTTTGATVGTSSSSVNAAAESVTSTPNGGGDTAGVGA